MNIRYFLLSLSIALFMAIGAANADGRIDVNTATITQLQSVSGIGPKTAAAIVDYRNTHGLFSAIEGLKNVKGIGDKKLEAIKSDVEVNHISE
ncbi:MAG: helix-hairpin-helix domain-containing protein [Mariprofundus sp.]|nr:helix-hairpin-helix domain-containing protein [Mariprofundus sp.]